jgi:hypothetical protein
LPFDHVRGSPLCIEGNFVNECSWPILQVRRRS